MILRTKQGDANRSILLFDVRISLGERNQHSFFIDRTRLTTTTLYMRGQQIDNGY